MTTQITSIEGMLAAATETVTMAMDAARAVQNELAHIREVTKDDRSPVTVADFAVQAIIALELRRRLGAEHIVGEEKADMLHDSANAAVAQEVVEAVQRVLPQVKADEVIAAIDSCDYVPPRDPTTATDGAPYWALDPVDGTKGFLRRQQYAIALGRIDPAANHAVTLGVMGCPNLPADRARPLDQPDATGCIYIAQRSAGAFAINPDTGERTTIHAAATPGDALRTCESVEKAHSKQSATARIMDHLQVQTDPVRLDSQCKYAVVGRGQADAYLRMPTRADYVEKIWDHAAGSLIATEAGAVVSDITGAPLDFAQGRTLKNNRGVICATPDVHARIIDAIATLQLDQPPT